MTPTEGKSLFADVEKEYAEAKADLLKAVAALGLEVPDAVWQDVNRRVTRFVVAAEESLSTAKWSGERGN